MTAITSVRPRAVRTLAFGVALFVGFAFLPVVPSEAAVVSPVETQTLPGLPVGETPAPGELRAAEATSSRAVTSQAVETPIAFSMVGFSAPEDAVVAFRTSDDGQQWTPWRSLHAHTDEGPDPRSAEMRESAVADRGTAFTAPLWVGDASWIQTRVSPDTAHAHARLDEETGADEEPGERHGEAADSLSPRDVDVHLLDTDGLNRGLLGRAADGLAAAWRGSGRLPEATASGGRPPIVSRQAWDADESWRRGRPSYSATIEAGVIHHTVGSNDYSAAQAPGIVRGIYAYHTRSLGWSDIGYNFLVDRFGTIYEGRAGGVDRAVIGAHAGGFNTSTFGVSLMGTFTSTGPSDAAVRSAARVVAWKFRAAGVRPDDSVILTSRGSTRYREGVSVRLPRLMGHRDVSSTECPGGQTYKSLSSLRELTGRLMGRMTASPAAEGLYVSQSANRRKARSLESQPLVGRRFVWWQGDETDVKTVAFWVDDTDMSGRPSARDSASPYALGRIDTRRWDNGSYTLTTRVARTTGEVSVTHTDFVVLNPPPERSWAYRMNVGGAGLRAPNGRWWRPDRGFVGGKTHTARGMGIHGTGFDDLYRSERFGMRAYRIDVAQPAVYEVTLRLAEIYYDEPGERVFDVFAEGQLRLRGLDIVRDAGPQRASGRSFRVMVTDGRLDLGFRGRRDLPKLSGLSVVAVAPAVMIADGRDRTGTRRLRGAVLNGSVFVWGGWPAGRHTSHIEFWLDDPQRAGTPLRTTAAPPFNLGRLNVAGLDEGRHTITTVVRHTVGRPTVTHNKFRVDHNP